MTINRIGWSFRKYMFIMLTIIFYYNSKGLAKQSSYPNGLRV